MAGGRGKKTFEVHVVPGTHWDREWRFSFQEMRQRLIEALDRAMDLLEKDRRVPAFTLDGQVLAVQDYLEARPQDRGRIKRLVSKGRLLIGPWYSLPDMPVLTGESIVRNLFHGITLSSELGGAMMECFTSSSWGQISQMPQICRGFGIDTYFSYHGVPGHRYPVEFWWEGADGSRVLFIRPPFATKSAFWLCEKQAVWPKGEEAGPLKPGSALLRNAYRMTDRPMADDTPVYLDDRSAPFDYDALYKQYRTFRDATAREVATRHILMGEFEDSQETPADLVRLVNEVRKRDDTGDDIHFSSIPEYFGKVRKAVGKLKVHKGEMRCPAKEQFTFRLCCPLSSRMYLKQINREAEHLLTKWAEPFGALAWLAGARYAEGSLSHAWRLMLLNHAHDNIGGCSVDAVHDDMIWRYRQITELGRAVAHRSLGHLTGKIGGRDVGRSELRLVVFNPLSVPRSGVLEAYVDVDESLPHDAMEAVDAEGRPVACDILSVSRPKGVPVESPIVTVASVHGRRVKIALDAADVPAMGYAEYRLTPSATKVRAAPAISCGPDRLENEHLKVRVNRNGTLSLVDKATGERFSGLHYFEDTGEARAARSRWYSIPPKHHRRYTSRGGRARVALVHKSSLMAQLRVVYDFRVPVSLDMGRARGGDEGHNVVYSGDRRSKRLVPLSIVSTLTLRKGSRRLDVETTLNNRAMDHRLRVMFPTDVVTKHVWADAPYDVVRRRIARIDSPDWCENVMLGEVTTSPMLRFMDVASGKRSLAILVDGLTEYEVIEDKRHTVAVTLLRAFFNAGSDPDTPAPPVRGSQCLGRHVLRYAILPHKGNWERGGVMAEARRHNVPLKAVQAMGQGSGDLPARAGFIGFSRDGLVVTALKKAEGGDDLIVRLLNPTSKAVETTMRCGFKLAAARFANLLEKPTPARPLAIRKGHAVRLNVAARKLITLRLTADRMA